MLLDEDLGAGVDVAGGLVEDEDALVARKRARCEQLFLAERDSRRLRRAPSRSPRAGCERSVDVGAFARRRLSVAGAGLPYAMLS